MSYTENELDRTYRITWVNLRQMLLITMIAREVDRLRREAQGSSDEDSKDIAEKRKKYKDKLMASVKARKQSTGKVI